MRSCFRTDCSRRVSDAGHFCRKCWELLKHDEKASYYRLKLGAGAGDLDRFARDVGEELARRYS